MKRTPAMSMNPSRRRRAMRRRIFFSALRVGVRVRKGVGASSPCPLRRGTDVLFFLYGFGDEAAVVAAGIVFFEMRHDVFHLFSLAEHFCYYLIYFVRR